MSEKESAREKRKKSDGPGGDVSMSFGDHLEELRNRVIKSVATVALCFFVCFYQSDRIFGIVSKPARDAAARVNKARIEEKIARLIQKGEDADKAREIVTVLYERPSVQNITPLGNVLVAVKLALVMAIFLASPIVFYQLWQFVAVGLYGSEQKIVRTFGPLSFVFFVAGACFFYFVFWPLLLEISFGFLPDVENVMNVTEYVSTMLVMTLLLGLVFELPLLMLILSKLGIGSHRWYSEKRRHAYLASSIVAALITPGDFFVAMLLLMLPLIGLYEIGVFLVSLSEKKTAART